MARDRITASDVYQFALSPFALWCEHHAPPHERDPPSGFQELLQRRGREHEARVLASRHPDAAAVEATSEEEAFGLALDAMRRGVPAIAGAPLLLPQEGLGGRADLLVRSDAAASAFGPYHYRVVEVKLARNLRREHRLQGAFYNHVLGRLQRYTPPTFALVNADHEETLFDHDEQEILDALAEIRAIRAGKRVEPTYNGCIWPWETYANKCAEAADDVSLVDGVGPSLRGTLVAAGYATVRALAQAREEELARLAGVGPARQRKLPVTARALATRTHVRLAELSFPDAPVEVFLDLEGTSEQTASDGIEPMDYLIGTWVRRRDGREGYLPFIARSLDGEEAMLREFLAWLEGEPDAILYHWAPYERTHLRKMCARYGLERAWSDLLDDRLRDLHKDATRAFAFPTYGTGLKKIAPYAGFHWRHKDVNAMESIALYLAYAADPAGQADKLQKVLDYNEDDCIATRVVKDWLASEGGAPRGDASPDPLA